MTPEWSSEAFTSPRSGTVLASHPEFPRGQHPRGQRVDDRRQRSPEPDLGRCYIPGRAVGATGITAGHPGAAEHQIVDFAGRDQH